MKACVFNQISNTVTHTSSPKIHIKYSAPALVSLVSWHTDCWKWNDTKLGTHIQVRIWYFCVWYIEEWEEKQTKKKNKVLQDFVMAYKSRYCCSAYM